MPNLYGESKITRIETLHVVNHTRKVILNLYGESKITRIETNFWVDYTEYKDKFIWRIQNNKD